MNSIKKELLEYLSEFITPERLSLYNNIIEHRTSYITVVLEDIYQPQNASAVLRSCDCFGIQHVNVIENRNKFRVNTEVSLGASKWITLNKFKASENNTENALRTIKNQGYRIVATSPHTDDVELQDFDIDKGKFALVFGSELPGISDIVKQEADEFLKIPMYGFTESFNISVSAAIILHHLSGKLRNSKKINWKLTEEERQEIKLQWLRNTIKRCDLIEKRFWKEKKIEPPV
jgi:tRNA (guanosine-2'-O-)-methyltransferase